MEQTQGRRTALKRGYASALVVIAVAAVAVIVGTGVAGCATFAVASRASDNGVAEYESRGVTATPGGTWKDFAAGVETIERARAYGAYTDAVAATGAWYAVEGESEDPEDARRLAVIARCTDGDSAACDEIAAELAAGRSR